MDFTPQINLLKGFCTLYFGVSAVDAELVFGKPKEIQVLDDNILETCVLFIIIGTQDFLCSLTIRTQ